tara:strand:- start:223 stop:513 length:291 start_codon:yes stop_codon:yes gene_type:complete
MTKHNIPQLATQFKNYTLTYAGTYNTHDTYPYFVKNLFADVFSGILSLTKETILPNSGYQLDQNTYINAKLWVAITAKTATTESKCIMVTLESPMW